MWLLNTSTLRLSKFNDCHVHPYAILSHKWFEEREEVLFEDVDREPWQEPIEVAQVAFKGRTISTADLQAAQKWSNHQERIRKREQKAGWQKVKMACARARDDGYHYIWIDSCAIDKSSSAELSESINSMYSWYENSAVCYAYLSDFAAINIDNNNGFSYDWWNFEETITQQQGTPFHKSEWFSRAWTLQELIAPKEVEFFNATWHPIGNRTTLQEPIRRRTGIPSEVLVASQNPRLFSVAQRMSWAANRKATRGEDIAYSLMGLFDINMPLLYGEGELKAFQRLQGEILRASADQSIFAWKILSYEIRLQAFRDHQESSNDHDVYCGLLAKSPAQFAECGGVEVYDTMTDSAVTSFHQTNIGLEVVFPVLCVDMNVYSAILSCYDRNREEVQYRPFLTLYLGFPSTSTNPKIVGRRLYEGADSSVKESLMVKDSMLRTMTIPNTPFPHTRPDQAHFGVEIGALTLFTPGGISCDLMHGLHVIARRGTWDERNHILTLPKEAEGVAMCVAISPKKGGLPWVWLKLGFDLDFRLWVWLHGRNTDLMKSVEWQGFQGEWEPAITSGLAHDQDGILRSIDTILTERIPISPDTPHAPGTYTHRIDRIIGMNESGGVGKIHIYRTNKPANRQKSWSWVVKISVFE